MTTMAHIQGFCAEDCRHRIIAKGYMSPRDHAMNIFAQKGQISPDLVHSIETEYTTADRELKELLRLDRPDEINTQRIGELRGMCTELANMRRHVIRVNARAALADDTQD